MSILDTGVKNVKNVVNYTIGSGALSSLQKMVEKLKNDERKQIIFFVDEYFKNNDQIIKKLAVSPDDKVVFVSVKVEPTTEYINHLVNDLRANGCATPALIVGMGGGITMDTAKAISNLLTNGGSAEDYQGWDLVKNPGIYKIAIPTISGTGAEATRTCVMTNKSSGLKLGMNSDYTVFDQIIMDPSLTKTVPRDQYFYTGMDAYIHCFEALNGQYRNSIGDAYSRETINLCRQVFLSSDMQSIGNREKLMVASYLGGCAIATSYVGVVHPFSAGLSVVLGIHHCVANCIVMRAMEEFYPEAYSEFWEMVEKNQIFIPKKVCSDLDLNGFKSLYQATIIHVKPLTNALGNNFKSKLTFEKVTELFKMM